MMRMIGLLGMMALLVGVVGCGVEDNPLSAEQSVYVGCWSGAINNNTQR